MSDIEALYKLFNQWIDLNPDRTHTYRLELYHDGSCRIMNYRGTVFGSTFGDIESSNPAEACSILASMVDEELRRVR